MPKSVTVYGRTIPVRYIKKSELDKFIQNAEGIWDTYTQTIYLNKEAPREIQLYYLYHEMGHAVKTFVGLDQVIPAEIQEIIVQSFATLIQDVLRQSRKLK